MCTHIRTYPQPQILFLDLLLGLAPHSPDAPTVCFYTCIFRSFAHRISVCVCVADCDVDDDGDVGHREAKNSRKVFGLS